MHEQPSKEHGGATELDQLVSALIDGAMTGAERDRLNNLLSESQDAVRRYHELLDNHEALCAIYPGDVYESMNLADASGHGRDVSAQTAVSSFGQSRFGLTAIVVSSLVVAALLMVAIVPSFQFRSDEEIATVTGLSGSHTWTGDRGEIEHDLKVGTKLTGGTIEGMTPESWFELTFRDGTTVMISGHSMLTFSERDQKELRLREGSFSANVVPQAPGRPMLVRTRSATMEVLGTRFSVNADLAMTVLDVSEGKVRAVRLSDQQSADVPANHRIVATADREFVAEQLPQSVTQWVSRIADGPDHMYGRWTTSDSRPASDGTSNRQPQASLKAVPYTTEFGLTIYTAACEVSTGDNPPVVLHADSEVRVQGLLETAHYVFIGVTVRTLDGEFAGRFQTIRPAEEFHSGESFDVSLKIRDFTADPSLKGMRSQLPTVPFNLVVESVWCHTLKDPAGLELTHIDIARADDSL